MGRELRGDPQNRAWGVLDLLATTDFPDIRLKAVIQSGRHGNVLLIPREGGYLVRLYVDLGDVVPGAASLRGSITADDIVAAARRVLAPYSLEAKEIPWWSVYEVGQRLTDKFDDVDAGSAAAPRVFVAGDACHTHSAKAGQGMNVSMQDAYNLGWKLAAVLQGRSPASLLATYSEERQPVAQQLIDFDRGFAKVIGARPKSAEDPSEGHYDAAEVEERFKAALPFTAGLATHYPHSLLTGEGTHRALADGFPIGMRFHSAPVVRVADARPMHLGHVHEADGRWRLYAFADRTDPADLQSPLGRLCSFLAESPDSPVRRHTPLGADIDAVFDLRAVFQQHHHDLDVEAVHPLLLPVKGRLGLKDYEKVFAADPAGDVFELRGIDRDRGCLVVVRPDQYVAHVLPLEAHEALARFFGAFMNDATHAGGPR
jgi:phenol 2-monooxygenase